MDADDLQQLIDMHYARIRRAAMGLCNDPWEADEIAQETFLAAYRSWGALREPAAAGTWLYGICVRIHRSRIRVLIRQARRVTRWVAHQSTAQNVIRQAETKLEQQQWREGIWKCVAMLPSRQREVIVLRFAEEMTHAQIATVLKCSQGTVKSRLHYGLRKLRDKLSRDGDLKHHPSQLAVEILTHRPSGSK